MPYTVKFTKRALEDLGCLSEHTALIITSWVRKHLDGCEDPKTRGRKLKSMPEGHWRYRIGNYRLLAYIQGQTVTLLAVNHGVGEEIANEQQR